MYQSFRNAFENDSVSCLFKIPSDQLFVGRVERSYILNT